MVITHVDLHSNMDTLLAVRGVERVCMDMMDVPETIDRAMGDVRGLSPDRSTTRSTRPPDMADTGTLGWVPAYHPVRTNTIQCDFAALIGPEHFRRWVLPALDEEAAYLGHCVYHLDGRSAWCISTTCARSRAWTASSGRTARATSPSSSGWTC